jgi:hypothetical protein
VLVREDSAPRRPPLPSGVTRFLFYSGILGLCWVMPEDPLEAVRLLRETEGFLYTPHGLVALLGLHRLPLWSLDALRWLAVLGLAAASVGLFGRLAGAVGATAFLALHGIAGGALGIDHVWLIPAYAAVLLALAPPDPALSLDALLSRRFSRYRFRPSERAHRLGSARATKAILVAVVFSYASAGIAKLMDGGLEWADGVSLQFYINTTRDHVRPIWPWLSQAIGESLVVCRLLSVATLVFELGSAVMLFAPRLRRWFVLIAVCFHVLIGLIMIPDYWPQCWVLLVIVGRAQIEGPADGSARDRVPSFVGAVLMTLLPVIVIVRVEWWPLTHVPMYGSYVGPHRVSEFPRSMFEDTSQLREGLVECRSAWRTRCPWWTRFELLSRTRIVLVAENRSRDLRAEEIPIPSLNQLVVVVSDVVMAEIAGEPGAAASFVRDLASLLLRRRPDLLAGASALELRYDESTGPRVLASASLARSVARPGSRQERAGHAVGAAPAVEELLRRERRELPAEPGHLLLHARGLLEADRASRTLGHDHVEVAVPSLLVRDRDAREAPAIEELGEHHVAEIRPPGLVEPTREDVQGLLVDEAQALVQHHEDAVDVDVPERKRHLQEVLHVPAQDDLPQGAQALLVGAIAQRRHGGVIADERHAPTLEVAGRLDRAQDRHAEAPERPRHHLLVAPAPLEVRPHQHGSAGEDGSQVPGVGQVGAVLHVPEGVRVIGEQVAQQQDLGAVCLEQAEHGVVVGHELVDVDRSGEVELRQRLGRHLLQLRAGPVHENARESPVRCPDAEGVHAATLLLIHR